ncbi:MAG TPA: chitobiase/beta-hexosaminidase C-terminal domain-containing protein, partial [Chitinophagaceae bacterium]|nr:chitobiase/beta-hexosaminidase C-terminal domain-containing protein [Chitinophagaceae bacterium]HMU59523.1 chitobiase/beta-hexosaminidase C-terminal domain-containing protein [Chitinophagaceae bacterium]
MKKFTQFFSLCMLSLTISGSILAQLQNPAVIRDDVWFQTFGWDAYNRPFVTAEGNFYNYINNRTSSLAASGFDAIWLPPPSASSGGMGYIPAQWFDFSSTSFGTQANLTTLLSNIRSNGMHPIADIVVNHRTDGTSGGFNFTNPSLGGCTAIAMNPNGGSQPGACGNNDTEGCDGAGYGYGWFAMELDHTNSVVQSQIKQFLVNLKTLGFEGWRWDFVKGFGGKYVGEYLMSTPYYASVGEFWDGSISKTQCWINQTGSTVSGTNPDKSMAFDFPLYYNLSTALTNSNYSLINSPAAAGLYGQFGYSDKAVTFIENHDSFKDNKYVGDNIMKGYAYILTHPGIPCVSSMHYYGGSWTKDGVTVNYGSGYQQKINELVAVRKANGINAWSPVVVSNSGTFYSAIIDGKVAVKIGSGTWNPGGGWTLATSGNDYAVWSIAPVNPAPTVTISPVSAFVTTPQTVTITATDNGTTTIYYTTDGSTPTASSTIYTVPFNVTTTTTVKAIAIDNGGVSSGVVSATYTFVTPTNFKVYLNTTGCPLWTTPRIHLWGEIPAGAIPSVPWPGRLMTNEGPPNLWSYSFTGIYSTNIVFNSGQSPTPSQQTRPDIIGVNQATTYTLLADCQSFTTTVPCTTPAPTGTTPVNYCQGATATPLTATGTALLWYTVATGGTGSATAPTPSTATPGSTIYYVSQTLNGCEGSRLAITVNVTATPAAPVVTTPVTYCQGATATPLTATGTSLLWYTVPTGGTGSATAPTPSTATVGSVTYYVSQTVNGCESPRASLVVTINAIPSAPGVTTPVTYCQGATATPLTATGTSLLWYTVPTGGTSSATAPTPSTATVGSTTYYVSQTVNGCESPRSSI